MIYAVIAFGYQLTFATSDTLNFGQGDALMLGAWSACRWSNHPRRPELLADDSAGVRVRRLAGHGGRGIGCARPSRSSRSSAGSCRPSRWASSSRTWPRTSGASDDLPFPSPLPESPLHFLGANVLPMEILVVVGALLMMLAVEIFNRKSIYGKAVVATFNDRDAAKLMGINTGLVITFSYALSSATAAFAGVLIAPLTLTGATMGAVARPEGLRGGHHRRAHLGMGIDRRRHHPRHRRDHHRLLPRPATRTCRAWCCCCWCWRCAPPACSARPRSRRYEHEKNEDQPPAPWPLPASAALLAVSACCSTTRITSTCSRPS
jgi:branched-chain amino acid transport system permease protein